MIETDHDECVRLRLIEHATELAHSGDGRIKLRRVLTGLAEKQRRRMARNHGCNDLSHEISRSFVSGGVATRVPRQNRRNPAWPYLSRRAFRFPSNDGSARTSRAYKAQTPNVLPTQTR